MMTHGCDPGPSLHSAGAAFKWDQQSVVKLKAQINVCLQLPRFLSDVGCFNSFKTAIPHPLKHDALTKS